MNTNVTSDKILSYIKRINLSKLDRIVIAVSGGVDSMVLADALYQLGHDIVVAHVNHRTRGVENDKESTLIRNWCEERNIPFFLKELDPDAKNQPDFQNFARNQRYTFFRRVKEEQNAQYIATAHHADDKVETFFINLKRSAGLNGLKSIPSENGDIIRPLISCTKKDIYDYATTYETPFLEDSSNQEEKYLRNQIRKKLIPVLSEIDPNYPTAITKSMAHLTDARMLLDELLDDYIDLRWVNDRMHLNLDKILKLENREYLLLRVFGVYSFTAEQVAGMLTAKTGSIFKAKKLEVLKNREELIMRPIRSGLKDISIEISDEGEYVVGGRVLKFSLIEGAENIDYKNDKGEFFAFSKNPFPLIVRSRKSGDGMKPLGMKGRSQTIKKFLVDKKVNLFDKEDIILLEKDSTILSIIGFTTDWTHRIINGKSAPYYLHLSII